MAALTPRSSVRICLKDQPGVMAQITTILGEHQISLASALQKDEPENNHVPVVYVTHKAVESAFPLSQPC